MPKLFCSVLAIAFLLCFQAAAFADSPSGASSQPSAATAAPLVGRSSRANLELIILGMLVGLIFKTTLDAIFKSDVEELADIQKTPELNRRSVLNLFENYHLFVFPVFILTLLRFVYGSYRFHETLSQELPVPIFLIDAAGLIGDFVFFYVAGLSITRSQLFFRVFIMLHLWDFLWFLLLKITLHFAAPGLDEPLRLVSIIFLAFDLLSALALWGVIKCCDKRPARLEVIGSFILLVIGILDFSCNYKFYFSLVWPPVHAAAEPTIALAPQDGKTSLYLAGPLFTQAEWEWNARLGSSLRQAGYQVAVPQELARPMIQKKQSFDAKGIFTANIAEIDKADMVIAILDGSDSDSGTCWECGYAYRVGKPIIGVRTDFRGGGDDSAGVNVMLSRSCREIVTLPIERRDDFPWLLAEVTKAVQRAKK